MRFDDDRRHLKVSQSDSEPMRDPFTSVYRCSSASEFARCHDSAFGMQLHIDHAARKHALSAARDMKRLSGTSAGGEVASAFDLEASRTYLPLSTVGLLQSCKLPSFAVAPMSVRQSANGVRNRDLAATQSTCSVHTVMVLHGPCVPCSEIGSRSHREHTM